MSTQYVYVVSCRCNPHSQSALQPRDSPRLLFSCGQCSASARKHEIQSQPMGRRPIRSGLGQMHRHQRPPVAERLTYLKRAFQLHGSMPNWFDAYIRLPMYYVTDPLPIKKLDNRQRGFTARGPGCSSADVQIILSPDPQLPVSYWYGRLLVRRGESLLVESTQP